MSLELDAIAARIRENVQNRPDAPFDLAQTRATFEAMGHIAKRVKDVTITEIDRGGIKCDRIAPKECASDREVIYFHGGAYALGSRETYRNMLSHIAEACGCAFITAEYRLAPEHPFPAGIDDCVAVWRTSQKPKLKRVMMGDSCGAALTLATMLRSRAEKIAMPNAAVLLSPWTDLDHTGESMKTNAARDPMIRLDDSQRFATMYLNGTSPRDPLASPLYADLAGLPPLYIQVGKDEVLLDDAARLATRASAVDVDVTLDTFSNVFHVWQFFAGVAEEPDEAIKRIGQFVRDV